MLWRKPHSIKWFFSFGQHRVCPTILALNLTLNTEHLKLERSGQYLLDLLLQISNNGR